MKTLGRIRQCISQRLALHLYKSLVVPDFDYADQVYVAMSKMNADMLQVLQNQCLRICIKSETRCNVSELHKTAGLPLLSHHRKMHCCNTVYKGMKNESLACLNTMFQLVMNDSERTLKSADNMTLVVAPVRLRKVSGNLRIRGARYFNETPINIKQANNYEIFKRRLKDHQGVT